MNFTSSPIVVIGDIILDEFVYGTATRISPEAPVPVIKIEKYEFRLGGAANVAANIRSLGGNPHVIGILGHDRAVTTSVLFEQAGMEQNGLAVVSDRRTTTKTRLLSHRQQIARMDAEDTSNLVQNQVNLVKNSIKLAFSGPNLPPAAVIISDYAKGVICSDVLDLALNEAHTAGIPVFLDPKTGQQGLYLRYTGRWAVMTPNTSEAEALAGRRIQNQMDLEYAGRHILLRYGCQYVLITRGEDGMALFTAGHPNLSANIAVDYIPAIARQVFDVSGAGDTVIAALALAHSSGFPILRSAQLANAAAAVVVGKQGTATCSADELKL